MSGWIKWSAAGIAAIAIGIGLYFYWKHQGLYPSTDDAYVQAHVVNISPEVSGPVVQVAVSDFQRVKKGQMLVLLDRRPFQIALNKAQAQLERTRQEINAAEAAVQAAEAVAQQRKAELTQAEQEVRRVEPLVKKKLASPAAADQAKDALHAAQARHQAALWTLRQARQNLGKPGPANAQLREAEAAVAQAQLDLSHTVLTAPADGRVANFSVRPGDWAQMDRPICALVESGIWWVSANYEETALHRIHPGMPATISVDMYPGITFKGTVLSLSPASGTAFSLMPPENATGNWVKVTQRFPVRVIINTTSSDPPLRVGASAHVTVDTTSNSGPKHKDD